MRGYGITFIPMSWHWGLWRKEHKTLFAIGPFRLVHYKAIPQQYGKTLGEQAHTS